MIANYYLKFTSIIIKLPLTFQLRGYIYIYIYIYVK